MTQSSKSAQNEETAGRRGFYTSAVIVLVNAPGEPERYAIGVMCGKHAPTAGPDCLQYGLRITGEPGAEAVKTYTDRTEAVKEARKLAAFGIAWPEA